MTLAVAIIAVVFSILSFKKANEQFKQNSESSDSLFKVQLENSKQLNDSLIYQIGKLQEITDNQLKISKEIYRSQLFSGRPKITLKSIAIKDTIYVDEKIFNLKIIIKFVNVGERIAESQTIRPFVVYQDFSGGNFTLNKFTATANLGVNEKRDYDFIFRIPNKYKSNFFYCFDFQYYDNILDETFIQSYYYHYYKEGGRFNFYNCQDNLKPKLKAYINKMLKNKKWRLFDI
ncbi:MAG: hypothetical protein IIC75_04625 [Bacteroidetes bacterium]|nr:hypothetical protein [Bacteroidota bacterium]